MALPTLAPILDDDLPAFCDFLHRNLNPAIRAEVWAEAFRQPWGVERPNNGFLVRDDAGRIVGGIGAIYARYPVRGRPERFCNITSWCVLEPYRAQSMRLALAVVSQPGWHFTDLSPTEVVAGSLRFLKFRPIDPRLSFIPTGPWPIARLAGVRVLTRPERIEAALSPAAAQVYRDHRQLPWLRHVAVGRPGAFCHVVYKRDRLKGVPLAGILAVGEPDLFLRYHRALGSHLLLRHGLLAMRVETRLIGRAPRLAVQHPGWRPKLYRSDTLADADISNLYSELAALDL